MFKHIFKEGISEKSSLTERNLEEKGEIQTMDLSKSSEKPYYPPGKEQQENTNPEQSEHYLCLLENAVEIMQIGVLITDLDGKIIYANQAQADIYGYQVAALLAQLMQILLPYERRKPLSLDQIKAWKGLIREEWGLKKDETIFPIRVMSEVVKDARGEPCGIVTSCEDISERKQLEQELNTYRQHLEELVIGHTTELRTTNRELQHKIAEHLCIEEALRKSEERYRIVLETVPDPIVVYDAENKIDYLNPAFSRIFHWTLAECKGQSFYFTPPENQTEIHALFEEIRKGGTIAGLETTRLTRENNTLQVSLSGAGFFDPNGKLQGSVITMQDMTERKKTEEEMKFLAYHDALTGLPNRKAFNMRLHYELAPSASEGLEKRRFPQHQWALLFLDLDRFKFVNDTLGHYIGDEMLQLIANRLHTCLRKSDYIFRFDGDEFTIILNTINDYTDVARVAQKIRDEIARPYSIHGHELYITASIGISLYPNDGDNGETLLQNADMAMYSAKEEGQGYRFFTEEMNQKAFERMRLENSLRCALQQDQFLVYYQPVADHNNQVIGMEALLRWNHPNLGWISPTQFIPIAEETGVIIPLGKWVLQAACTQAQKWHDMGYPDFSISVNLSTRQFREPDLTEMIEQVLAETHLAPNRLKLEVTESGIMDNPDDAIAKMHILRAKGIHFSIDDFGTGYSSLSYLKRLPIDILKIDRSFVMDAPTDKDDQEIIKTIIAMAHNLRLDTIAEGVETREQQQFLARNGCRMMQGFYFGHPMPADQFEARLCSTLPQHKTGDRTYFL
ncbi:sensory box/GGDEF family protein [Candidatus Vecturithrix granuli]|uniref:Sensory box/GGDEF family protein n=1 Tax=Vecturithrix granuli TaxID=1499967 RepID=A0A081BTZ6_VECG1|nr:sensory box/GGDEF family protein [Candidatus Vecturithrix granuli]